MNASDWDDGTILARTTLVSEGSLSRLSLDIGGDVPFTSELAAPDELRKRMVAWCAAVRNEVKSREAVRKQAAAAAAQAGGGASAPPTAAQVAGLQTPMNAVAHAKRQYEIASEMLSDFCTQQARLEERIAEVRENLDGWACVLATFQKAVKAESDDD